MWEEGQMYEQTDRWIMEGRWRNGYKRMSRWPSKGQCMNALTDGQTDK